MARHIEKPALSSESCTRVARYVRAAVRRGWEDLDQEQFDELARDLEDERPLTAREREEALDVLGMPVSWEVGSSQIAETVFWAVEAGRPLLVIDTAGRSFLLLPEQLPA